ncbi:osmotically-inducible protein OsmY [Salmonella enterica subsp. enterica serovar Muenchen]|nr:divisome-associated lipoprotein YraP [Salmonella enterica]EBR9314939.1 osmotically-inducible protein OsmY [Salmonella enterica subsp. enterica serovar Muenchen]EBI1926260.1 divisome-associated lipoprotein YraP [Salmonella enterica]EBW7189805.1 osmotically-inducible protein OsmY [Salmonella enterica subsp. enterica serovar Muenchen]EBX4463331.1 osmotically-inducible protein OsmY [Salmonella enterica subsp. enterica serovar Muenchen]
MPVKHIPLLPLMFLFALLSGCAPAVIITSASVATRTATDPRTTGRQIDDGTLTLRVSHAISSAGLPPLTRVTTTVYQGNVLLTGEVPDEATRQAASAAASSVSGVRHIWNETRTGFPVSTGQKVNDTWLASDIRARLLLNRDTRLADIKVVTENNEVFLMGLVTPEEGQHVTELVSRISGVTHVTTAWVFKRIPAQTPPAG